MEQWTPDIFWSSDRSLRIVLGDRDDDTTHARVVAVWRALSAAAIPGVIDVTAAYAVVQVAVDAAACGEERCGEIVRRVSQVVLAALGEAASGAPASPTGRLIEIPICYGGEHGPDLAETAALRGMTPERLIELHASATYSVRFLGFSPGFAYLSGLPEAIHAPRLATPRPRIAAGSVGIAGSQTGIYPQATPGGWRIIGRAPLRMFDPSRGGEHASLLRPGDSVRFLAWASCPGFSAVPAAHVTPRGDAPRLGQDAQATPHLHIIHPGHFTTVQDLGRSGCSAMGVARCGAMDAISLRVGNRLVGNADGAAGLEMTLSGCTVECDAGAVVAITGADAAAVITRPDGSMIEVARWQAFTLRPGERLKIAAMRDGARSYLCIAGGIDVPIVLGSRSTHVTSGIGGLEGRAVRAGDLLPIGHATGSPVVGEAARSAAALAQAWIAQRTLVLTSSPHVGTIASALKQLHGARWTVTARSDRSGVRMLPRDALGAPTGNLLTEPMLPGGGFVQLPPDGQPIILGPDGPTTGGYAVIAAVAEASMPILGQLRPGDEVVCEVRTETEARTMLADQRRQIDALLPPRRGETPKT